MVQGVKSPRDKRGAKKKKIEKKVLVTTTFLKTSKRK